MKLHSLKIEGFRRHSSTEILFSDATFLIGQNNVGKSSVLAALEYLLSGTKRIPNNEFLMDKDGILSNKIILTAEFRNLPQEAKQWRGFKGRVLNYDIPEGKEETGLRIVYRKIFELNKDYTVEMMQAKLEQKECFAECKTLSDYINAGLEESIVEEYFKGKDRSKNLVAADKKKLAEIEEINDVDESVIDWCQNPGGIPNNVLSKIPTILIIPAQDKMDELNGEKGALSTTLKELFNDVRESSEHYKRAQKHLELLAKELDPSDKDSEFGKMMGGLNRVLDNVFPNSEILAKATLSDADTSIKPKFEISMQSNISTDVNLQGTGMIRSAVFALLKYKTERDLKKNEYVRPLIVGFEEPEIYLHPNAAQHMRETIYDLASSMNNQIVCTTHSPYMIDISKKPSQILNNLSLHKYLYNNKLIEGVKNIAFTTTDSFKQLQEDDKSYVKMVLKIDDYIAKVFFTKRTIIVEGDTEELVLKETIKRMPNEVRKIVESDIQIIKARGKAAIIPLVKYLKSMGINLTVIHDKDSETEGAVKFNKPIKDAVGSSNDVFMMENCIEDVLGYEIKGKDKPYKAYRFIEQNWDETWESVSENWRGIMEAIFKKEFELIKYTAEELAAVDSE